MAKFLQLNSIGLPVMVEESATAATYSESIYYSGGLAASTNITLPNSGSFTSSTAKDLLVILNDRVVEQGRDFNVIGAGPTYTQIAFTYALTNDSVVVFRKGI
jgi:hypothetical protein